MRALNSLPAQGKSNPASRFDLSFLFCFEIVCGALIQVIKHAQCRFEARLPDTDIVPASAANLLRRSSHHCVEASFRLSIPIFILWAPLAFRRARWTLRRAQCRRMLDAVGGDAAAGPAPGPPCSASCRSHPQPPPSLPASFRPPAPPRLPPP